jgi:hypothetical protein
MVYMFIARITMAEGSDVKIGFHTLSGRVARNGVKMRTRNPLHLKRTPDSTCVAVGLIVIRWLEVGLVSSK